MFCPFLAGNYMFSCGALGDAYVQSYYELDEYCKHDRHKICPLYCQSEAEELSFWGLSMDKAYSLGRSMHKDNELVREEGSSEKNERESGNPQETWIEGVLWSILTVKNIEELAVILDKMSGEIEQMQGSGQVTVQDRQRMALSLTYIRLVLNDLDRIETQKCSASKESACRFVELEGRIRSIHDQLDRI